MRLFSQTISQFTALVWQQLEQYMISVNEDLVKQFVFSFIHQRWNLRQTSLTKATSYTSPDKASKYTHTSWRSRRSISAAVPRRRRRSYAGMTFGKILLRKITGICCCLCAAALHSAESRQSDRMFSSFRLCIRYYYAPPLIGGGIKRCFCLTSVCRVHRAQVENREA